MRSSWDWIAFFRAKGIPYSETGPNIGRGFVGMSCPFCASGDPSEHFTISTTTTFYQCWRNQAHRGTSPAVLISALLRVSLPEAKSIAATFRGKPVPSSTDALRERLRVSNRKERGAVEVLDEVLPPEGSVEIAYGRGTSKKFLDYLRARGFDRPEEVAERYGLRGTMVGELRYRILFPLEASVGGKIRVVGWTGRAIVPARLRYSTWPAGGVHPGAVFGLSDAARTGGKALALVEGPVDAAKVGFLGRDRGIRAIALLGLRGTPEKAASVLAALGRGSRAYPAGVVGIPDEGAAGAWTALARSLGPVGLSRLLPLPDGVGDAGELSPDGFRRVFEKVRFPVP